MKLLHAADLHIGLTRYGRPTSSGGNTRLDDFAATLDRLVESAIAHEVAAVIIAGDALHTRWASPAALDILARAATRLRKADILFVVLPGNHDGMSTLGDASSHALLWLDSLAIPGVYVLIRPGAHILYPKAGQLVVVAVPYPHKRTFDSRWADMSSDQRIIEAGRVVDDLIRAFAAERRPDAPLVLAGHFTTVAAKLGSEQTMKMTWDVSIDPAVFEPYDYVALGHIHRAQQVAPNAWYAGSPEYIDFGEEGQPKGWNIVEVEPGAPPVVERVVNPARELFTFMLDDETAEDVAMDGAFAPGAIVKLRYITTARPKADRVAALRQRALGAGASWVVHDWKPPQVASRARVVVAPETSRADLLRAWLDATGQPIEPALTAGRRLIDAVGSK